MGRIFTLGYGGMSLDEFMEILRENGVETVVDVRRFPTSKVEEFKKERLRAELERRGFSYIHIEELGGFRGGYQRYMKSQDFRKGLERLENIARKSVSAIICVEENPAWCHRRHIARSLERRGWEVVHLRRRPSARSARR